MADLLGQQGYNIYQTPVPPQGAIWQVVGSDTQIVEVLVPAGGCVMTEPGTMCYAADGLSASVSLGGCMQCCKRSQGAGESMFRLVYKNKTDSPLAIGITPNFPAKLIPVDLTQYSGMIIKRDAFCCALSKDVKFELRIARSIGAACCAGMGFILNEIHGSTTVFLNAGGTILQKVLEKGEEILVDTHSVVAFERTVSQSIRRVGSCKTMCCGGEGLFNTKLKGPGLVLLQSMPFDKYVKAVTGPFMRMQAQSQNSGGDGGDSS